MQHLVLHKTRMDGSETMTKLILRAKRYSSVYEFLAFLYCFIEVVTLGKIGCDG